MLEGSARVRRRGEVRPGGAERAPAKRGGPPVSQPKHAAGLGRSSGQLRSTSPLKSPTSASKINRAESRKPNASGHRVSVSG